MALWSSYAVAVLLCACAFPFEAVRAQAAPALKSSSHMPDEDVTRRIETYLRPFQQTNNFSGVIHVARGNQVLFQKGYGLAHPAFDSPNTPETRFHVASVSKIFTAAAILLLEERGKLNTTDPVSKFLPDYPNGDKIRLEHLLRHTSGIPNIQRFPELSLDAYLPYTATTVVATFKDKPLDFEPGARSRYTNSDYNLLALIIEKVSGQSFGEFLKVSLLDPLGLRATFHDGDATRVIKGLASGTEPEGLLDTRYVPYLAWSTKTGSGSIVSSAADLCTFSRALFGGQLLQPASVGKMMRPEGVFPYGWTDRERAGRKGKGVGGRSPGFISNLEYFPDDGTCIVILTNSYSSVGQVIAPDIATLAFGQSVTPPPIAYLRPRPGQLADFAGRFQMPENYFVPNTPLTIHDRGDFLEAKWDIGLTTVIYPTGGDDFVDRTNWAMVHFIRDSQGQITGFVYKLLQDFNARKLRTP